MRKLRLSWILGVGFFLLAVPALAVDGVVLINQATVMAAGGFPYKINQPGSYRLSGNLIVSGPTDALDINADGVTLDLNGFSITGPVVCTGEGASLSCSVPGAVTDGVYNFLHSSTIVKNGTVQGFVYGVFLGKGGLVEEIMAQHNGGSGIYVESGVVRRNNTSYNGDGITALHSIVTENIARSNGGSLGGVGISAAYSAVTDNVASLNGTYGLNLHGGIWGSNILEFNGTAPVIVSYGAISQNNNDCGTGSPC